MADDWRLSDLAFHVLLALGTGPSHGYAIGKDIEERSGGRLDPTTGALYQVLGRLTADGLIAAVDGPGNVDVRRKYFALTAQAAARQRRRQGGSTRSSGPRVNASSIPRRRDVRLFEWLLRMLPPSTRRDYADAMAETSQRRLDDARRLGVAR